MKLYYIKQNRIENRGFTILETLVAVAILMISIAGPMTIAHKGLLSSIYAREHVTASYLAQDAMEYIKNVKDNNLLQNKGWLDVLSSCDSSVDRCTVDTNTYPFGPSAIVLCPSTCTFNTQFSRYFYIVPNSTNPDEATLIVEVTWKSGTIDNIVTYQSEIFNILK